jgi:hypothetical protein
MTFKSPSETAERAPASEFPSVLEHKHGLNEWAPMLPERSLETVEPGKLPTERFYRCQRIGCDAVIRLDAANVRTAS